MKINCFWEHNGSDTLLYATEYIGAYTRGENLTTAIKKMPKEIMSYSNWCGGNISGDIEIVIMEEKESALNIADADSDALFESEKLPLTRQEYENLKKLALKSAHDFLTLYKSIPNKDKDKAIDIKRKTFYGQVPRTANEMYLHTKNVNEYYFAEIEVDSNNNGNIYECRKHGFKALEQKTNFLQNTVMRGSYDEGWTIRKVIRRFIWHDRIHAKAMYRLAIKLYGTENVKNLFFF